MSLVDYYADLASKRPYNTIYQNGHLKTNEGRDDLDYKSLRPGPRIMEIEYAIERYDEEFEELRTQLLQDANVEIEKLYKDNPRVSRNKINLVIEKTIGNARQLYNAYIKGFGKHLERNRRGTYPRLDLEYDAVHSIINAGRKRTRDNDDEEPTSRHDARVRPRREKIFFTTKGMPQFNLRYNNEDYGTASDSEDEQEETFWPHDNDLMSISHLLSSNQSDYGIPAPLLYALHSSINEHPLH